MGEKETAAGGNERTGQLNVSATPGGSASAGVVSAAVSSVGNLAPPVPNPASAATGSNPLYSEPGNAGNMPAV